MSVLEIIAAGFAVATILSCGFGLLLAACVLVNEVQQLAERVRPPAVPVREYPPLRVAPVDEVAARRAMREGGRVA